MKLFRFDTAVGRTIDQLGSAGLGISRLVRLDTPSQIGCVYLGPGGRVGRHQAAGPQRFAVVQGAGWVIGDGATPQDMSEGIADCWTGGGWHQAGTTSGFVAIVIECASLDQKASLPTACAATSAP